MILSPKGDITISTGLNAVDAAKILFDLSHRFHSAESSANGYL